MNDYHLRAEDLHQKVIPIQMDANSFLNERFGLWTGTDTIRH